jgi:hypothetical protein
MNKKMKIRQRFFVPREIRISIALIVLWSFLAVGLLMYLTKELGVLVGGLGLVSFIVVITGYVLVVIILTISFSHRLFGPFKRLNIEIDEILKGNFHKRLRIRMKDDVQIRTFVSQVNRLLDELEEAHRFNGDFLVRIQSELTEALSQLNRGKITEEEIRDLFSSLRKKASALSREFKPAYSKKE